MAPTLQVPDLKRAYCRKKDSIQYRTRCRQEFKSDENVGRKARCKSELSCEELKGIIASVREKKRSYKEAAGIHRVKPALVQTILSALKKKPETIQQAELKEEQRRKKLRVVIAESERKLNSADGLLKAQQV